MKTKTIILLLFLVQSFLCFGQEKSLKESVEEFVKEFKIKPSTSKIERGKNPFAGKTMKGTDEENARYFLNEKYYIDSNAQSNELRTYKIVKNGRLQIAVLLDDNGKIEAYMSQKNENEFWYKYEYGSIIRTFKIIKVNDAEREINIDINEVDALNYSNPKVTLYTKNGKLGIKYQGEKILPTECDSLDIYDEMAGIYSAQKISLYHTNGSLLADNLKSFYKYGPQLFQVLDSENKMYFIDNLAIKHKPPMYDRHMMGNDTDDGRTVTYELENGKIYKSVYTARHYYSSQDSDEDSGNDKSYSRNYGNHYVGEMKFPKKAKELLLVNNEKKISAEDYWYNVAFYKPLPPNYVILKSREKLGVWDIEENKSVLPFKYDKIVPKESHLYLEKNGLITCYPYIGQKPKYKILEDYIEYFARFEYPDGRKGWVDRKGLEYFDFKPSRFDDESTNRK